MISTVSKGQRFLVDLPPDLQLRLQSYCDSTGATKVAAVRLAVGEFLDLRDDNLPSKFSVQLTPDLATKLDVFRRSCAFDVRRENIVARALPEFLDEWLSSHPEERSEFDAELERVTRELPKPVRLAERGPQKGKT
jgi:hypothetical protein